MLGEITQVSKIKRQGMVSILAKTKERKRKTLNGWLGHSASLSTQMRS
jgi:hypothetical protein